VSLADGPAAATGRLSPEDSRFWLAAIAGSSDDAIVGKDLNGIVTSWNRAAELMFGYTAEEIVGQSITRIVPPNRVDEEATILARIRHREKIVQFETERRRKDGALFPVSITVSPIRDDENRIIGISKIARDLTERDRREAKLHAANAELERLARHLTRERDKATQANRAKSLFLAAMSHELRTPLNGVLGYAQLLHTEGGLNATQRQRVEGMLTAGRHLLQMITSVLDLTEIEAGRVETDMVECDVQSIAMTCLDLVRPAAEAKNLALSISTTPGTSRCLVTDPVRLRQVVLNLLGNATKFTNQGAIELRLRALADRPALRVEVTDTGPGISPDQRQRLFHDFERLGPTGSVEGAGLGLALSARLATLMGGRLGYDDNPLGGSVFWLELPLGAAAKSSSAEARDAPSAEPVSTALLNVLIVDDVLMNRDIASSFLRNAGHTVTCVETGAEAIAAVSDTDFDVVLMDVRMPEMDGLEATRRIRALQGKRGRVPVVALTAHAFTEQIEECRNAGMDGHVAKPFDATMLQAVVVRAAGRRAALPHVSAQQAAITAVIAGELPVFDPHAFDRSARYLAPDTVATYIQTIAEGAEALRTQLCQPSDQAKAGGGLAEAAHALAGSAGLFGFQRLAALGRRFEQAIPSSAADARPLADALTAAITATLLEIREHPAQFVKS
jgi:PAS domain S-box-containing protein